MPKGLAVGRRKERRTCPWVVSIAEAAGLMRGSESSESSGEGRRREEQRCKAHQNRDVARFHHRASAKVLDEPQAAPGTRADRWP